MKKKLCKSRKNKFICGVCGGIGEYFNIDPTIVRLICVIVGLLKGFGLLLYVIACIIMPYNEDIESDDIDNLKSANVDEELKNHKSQKDGKHSDEDFNSYFDK